jgi:hypothetical protein
MDLMINPMFQESDGIVSVQTKSPTNFYSGAKTNLLGGIWPKSDVYSGPLQDDLFSSQ